MLRQFNINVLPKEHHVIIMVIAIIIIAHVCTELCEAQHFHSWNLPRISRQSWEPDYNSAHFTVEKTEVWRSRCHFRMHDWYSEKEGPKAKALCLFLENPK